MRYLWFVPALLFLSCEAHTPVVGRESDAAMNDVLMERPIGDAGDRLVVTRGPDRDPAVFKALWSPPPDLRENPYFYYEVRVELRSPEAEPAQLATRLRVGGGRSFDKGSVVLDALVERANIVLAMAEGSVLAVWQIGIGHSPCWVPLGADKPWTLNAVPYRIDDKRVSMKLGRTDDGRLTVKVIEKDSRQHSVYEEVEKGSLQFKRVRQWREARGK